MNTPHVTGADKLSAYLTFYASVKEAAKRNVVGADTVLADLAQFFPRGSSNPPSPEPPSPPPV